MGLHICNLNAGEDYGKSFQHELSQTTDEILNFLYSDPSSVQIKEYYNHIIKNHIESPRSIEEYFVEYIMIGLYWRNYAGYASGLSTFTKKIAHTLYKIRNFSPVLAPGIDKVRGRIASKYLLHQDNSYELIPIVENFERLIEWLDASKYFIQEHHRLLNWAKYLKQKSPIYVSNFLNSTREISKQFIEISQSRLGIYTSGVETFRQKAQGGSENREDIVYVTRPEEDYFLNMIGVEIINRANRQRFNNTIRKIVVLPECMSNPDSGKCRAKATKNTKAQCQSCTPSCTANQIAQKLEKNGVEMKIIQAPTSFSHYVKTWEHHPKIGIVAVGCVLSLLSKSYELLSLGIPSQCVFIDNQRCEKHWPLANSPATINQEAIYNTLNIKHRKISNLELILN